MVAETILIDTANFSPNQLVDDLDRDEYEWSISGLSEWDRENVYSDITKARFDISGLSPRELLLKDAKFVSCKNNRAIFSSTLHCDLEDFFSTPGVFEDLKVSHHFCKFKHKEDMLLFYVFLVLTRFLDSSDQKSEILI